MGPELCAAPVARPTLPDGWLDRAAQRGLLVPGSGASIVSFYAVACTGRINLALAACVFLLVYSCYRFDAWTDIARHPSAAQSRRTRALDRGWGRLGPAAIAGLAGLALAYLGGGAVGASVALVFPLLVGFYSASAPGDRSRSLEGGRRIKDLPGLKGIYVALGWALLIVFANLFFVDGAPPATLLIMFSWLGLESFVNTVACDFKDLERDRSDGTATLPLILGTARTLRLLRMVNVTAACLWLCGVIAGAMPAWTCTVVLVSVYLHWTLSALERSATDVENLCSVAMDSFGLTLLPLVAVGLAWG